MSRILRAFFNSDLRCGHEGLAKMAKDQEVDVMRLEPGQFVIFVNHAKDRLKLFTSNNIIAYLKLVKGQVLDMRTIALIPKAFQAKGSIDYDAALKEVIQQNLGRKRRQVTSPLEAGKKLIEMQRMPTYEAVRKPQAILRKRSG